MNDTYTIRINGQESAGTIEDFLVAVNAPVGDAVKDGVLKNLNALGRVSYSVRGNDYQISHTFH